MDSNSSSKIHPDFSTLFFKNESKVLLGHKFVNLLILILMLTITFLAIGLSNGSLNYLKGKMKDPFVNSAKIVVPTFSANRVLNVIYDLNQDNQAKNDYHFKNLTGYYQYPLDFLKFQSDKSYEYYGRSINIENPLLESICTGDNIIGGKKFQDEEDLGLIVKKSFLNKMGYPQNSSFINHAVSYSGIDKAFPIPIIAIVNDLPNNANFVTTPYFYNLIQRDIRNEGPLSFQNTQSLILFTPDTISAFDLKSEIDHYLSSNWGSMNYFVGSPSSSDISIHKGYELSISFNDSSIDHITLIDSIFKILRNAKELSEYKFTQLYTIKTYSIDEKDYGYGDFDRVSINFKDLNKIKEFRTFFYKQTQLDIDMGQVESKDNYNLVSGLTRILSVILIGFSILSISLFLSNIFKRHLEKIKMNIGTFKAFGIDNRTLQLIYFKLVGYFILITMFISFIISSAIGYLGFGKMLFRLLSINYSKNDSYFQIFDIWTLFSVVSILLVSFVVLYFTINRILSKTPGDLIYDR